MITHWFFRIGIDFWFVGLMALCLSIVLWGNGASLNLAQNSVLYPIGMMVVLLVTRTGLWIYQHKKGTQEKLSLKAIFFQTLRDWTPFILIDFIYENLHDLSKIFHTHDVAGTLVKWDIALFGVEPTLYAQKFFHPLLTDTMAFVYALYILFPLIIMYFLSYRNRRLELQEIILALSFTFLLGFLGYLFFPCSPPRYFLENDFTSPHRLYGLFLYNTLQGKWDSLSVIRSGAFPSLHVGISTVALIYATRFRKWSRFDNILFWIFLVLIVSLWFSTIYLRHHWFIDIAAGWMIAYFSSRLSPLLIKGWEKLKNRCDPQRVTSAPDNR